jgi:hypothetical protein
LADAKDMPAEARLSVLPLPTVAAIRDHVREVLCAHDRLDGRQAELRQAKINRAGKDCGLLFQICGPRLLRSYAIWAGAESRILFYESTGLRFAETKVVDGPEPSEALKSAA